MSLCAAFSWVELVLCHIVRVYCQNYDCVLRKQWSSISCLSLIQYLLSFACFIVSPTISVSATARKRLQTHWHSFVRLQCVPYFPLRSENEFTRRIFWYVMRCPSPAGEWHLFIKSMLRCAKLKYRPQRAITYQLFGNKALWQAARLFTRPIHWHYPQVTLWTSDWKQVLSKII